MNKRTQLTASGVTTVLFLIVGLIFSQSIYSQRVNIGQQIPNVFVKSSIGYKKNAFKIRDEIKGKVSILDFWGIYCSTCIASMPKMNSLQQKFKNDLNFFYVTRDNKSKVLELVNKKERIKNHMLPMIVADSLLGDAFPHLSVPHVIWIDRSGYVQEITASEYVTESNISRFIKEGTIDLPTTKEVMDVNIFGGKEPFISIDKKYNSMQNTFHYSYIGGMIPQIKNSIQGELVDTSAKTYRMSHYNKSLASLYELSFSLSKLRRNQYILTNLDSSIFVRDMRTGKNTYCYDLIIQDSLKENQLKYMREDLDRYFQIKSNLITEKVQCYVIKIKDSTILKQNNSNIVPDGYKLNQYIKKQNTPWINVTYIFSSLGLNTPFPIIDETGINKSTRVTITLPDNWHDIEFVNKSLSDYGLKVETEWREQKVIVLSKS